MQPSGQQSSALGTSRSIAAPCERLGLAGVSAVLGQQESLGTVTSARLVKAFWKRGRAPCPNIASTSSIAGIARVHVPRHILVACLVVMDSWVRPHGRPTVPSVVQGRTVSASETVSIRQVRWPWRGWLRCGKSGVAGTKSGSSQSIWLQIAGWLGPASNGS
jgi:hypothetical protein